MTVTASPTGHPAYTQTMPCSAESAATARNLVRTALAAWGLGHLAEDGALIVSELVTNSVRHTRCRYILVSVTRPPGGVVRIGVVDKCHTLPVLRAAGDHDVRGRGLAVVEAVSWRWGTDRLRWGKRVWGELRCEPGP
jgi:serine/threonine-protein kinase RsbW